MHPTGQADTERRPPRRRSATASLFLETVMNRRTSSAIAFSSSVVAAALAATVMAGRAYADDITIDTTPFVSQRSRAEVQAELFNYTSSTEWAMQQNDPSSPSGYTRQQARSDYIAARDQVHAMNGEDSGSATLAQVRSHAAPSQVAVVQSSN
jgi:hypothetical protein